MMDKRKKAAALTYDKLSQEAPRISAIGKGKVAEKIIEKAKEHDVPIVEDPTLVELLSELDINETIPEELYEAVDIDGGSNLAKFWHVTFPYLKPILKVLLVVNGLRIFNEFETAFVMMGERPPAAADVVSLHVYNQAFINWNFGLASAMAISWVFILAIVAFILAKTTRIHYGEDL